MNPAEQIAEVLAQHDWDVYANEDGTGGVLCPCGWKVVEGTGRDVNAHLAEHITLALGLTEERRKRSPSRVDESGRNEWLPEYFERRWVSGWSVVGDHE